jgi:hypothetical protein
MIKRIATKSKPRKAPAVIDPVFAAIAEHKVLSRESNRLEESCWTVRAEAEKKYGEWVSAPNDWPGETTVTPFYDRWHRAANAERKAAMRMARTKPTTLAGAAALVAYTRRDMMKNPSELSDWIPIALKTVAAALGAWPS